MNKSFCTKCGTDITGLNGCPNCNSRPLGFPIAVKVLAVINGVLSIPISIVLVLLAFASAVESRELDADIFFFLASGYFFASITGAITFPLVKKKSIAIISTIIAFIVGLLLLGLFILIFSESPS